MVRIEIIHWKEEDEPCGVTVFLDGEEVQADVYLINPCVGCTRAEWDEKTDFQCSMASPRVAAVLRDARNDAADQSPYVQEDNGYH